MNNIIEWDVYEVSSIKHSLVKNKVRGRIRKFAIENNINLLVENSIDDESKIRFAVFANDNIDLIREFIVNLFDDAKIEKVLTAKNPVLSKLKVNSSERYEI